VHRIFSSCSKSEALLLQPGDSLLRAGALAACGNRWDEPALGKLLSVLMDDSESLGCVFRRPERPPGKRQGYVWYACGVTGTTSTEGGSLGMLADHSVLVVPQYDSSHPAGRQMRVCFHHLRSGEVCCFAPSLPSTVRQLRSPMYLRHMHLQCQHRIAHESQAAAAHACTV
jgi:hypothetical protein